MAITGDTAPDEHDDGVTRHEPDDDETKEGGFPVEKRHKIEEACDAQDFDSLRELATSRHGLLDDKHRRIAWPILLGCAPEKEEHYGNWKGLDRHQDEDQVSLDVNRSFVYYPENDSESRKDARKEELSNVITAVLRQHPFLHYFQGYHDIVQVLLLVLGERNAIPAVTRLSVLRIRDFMLPTMSGTEPHLHLLPSILYAADRELFHHLSQTQPFFALAATITLYAHDIEAYGDIARLFDFLLASEAVMSLYLFAVIVMSRKSELLDIEAEEPEMLHSVLSKLPKPLDLEGLIQRTLELFHRHPPETLPGRVWSKVSPNSVLKTTRDVKGVRTQTLAEGQMYFLREAEEIRKAEEWKRRQHLLRKMAFRYRRPAVLTGTAIVVAILALVFRDSNHAQSIMTRLLPFTAGLQQRLSEIIRPLFT